MNQSLIRVLFTMLSGFSFISCCYSQSNISGYEIGINAGSYIYQGDLTPSRLGSFRTPSFVFGLQGSKKLSSSLAVRLDVNVGRLRGNESKYSNPGWRQQRNFKFNSSVRELVASAVYSPLSNRHKLAPYLFAGVGLASVRIAQDYSDFNSTFFAGESLNERLDADIKHGLPKALLVLPVGMGMRYELTNSFSLNAEGSYRLTRNDYLDGFSKSANDAFGDHYYKFSIGINYAFGSKNNYACPPMRY